MSIKLRFVFVGFICPILLSAVLGYFAGDLAFLLGYLIGIFFMLFAIGKYGTFTPSIK